MPNLLYDLVTVAEAKTYFAMSGQGPVPADPDLDLLITQVSRQLTKMADRRFPSQPYTEVMSGNGSARQMVPEWPIVSIASLAVDGVAIPASTGVLVPGYIADPRLPVIYLRGGYRFNRGTMNVEITYTGGYAPIPDDLKSACLQGLAASIQYWDFPAGAESFTAGGSKIDLGGLHDQADMVISPNVNTILLPFQRVAPRPT